MPTGLIILTAIPVIAGAGRLAELTGGAEVTPDNARFLAVPFPLVLHIISACLYCVLGAFQFTLGFRGRRRAWHRVAGRVLVFCGLAAAFSGLWMTVYYPYADGDGDLLAGLRLVFGSAMAVSIVLGLVAILRRDVARHSAWMMRGYAIAQGAGTTVLTYLFWVLVVGAPGEFARAMLIAAAWVINLAVAEWVIRKRRTRSTRAGARPVGAGRLAAG